MLHNINPRNTPSWRKLVKHHKTMKNVTIQSLFEQESTRFDSFSIRFEDMLVDYSKNIISKETISLLVGLAKNCRLKDAIKSMYTGEKINATEGRAVLHTALSN